MFILKTLKKKNIFTFEKFFIRLDKILLTQKLVCLLCAKFLKEVFVENAALLKNFFILKCDHQMYSRLPTNAQQQKQKTEEAKEKKIQSKLGTKQIPSILLCLHKHTAFLTKQVNVRASKKRKEKKKGEKTTDKKVKKKQNKTKFLMIKKK
ncbi:hypothetical protein RFI_21221 [Reticulomyxa filosa]|uniref:Uncharacterized protein n=1 Tax=Reticulomyxa filosa TaxID=46433 RepID=X6MQJ7_RETFI|nr:hypothetical protein RFI_21221 [Reticulomyxa filosa]|eukprot:ETO16134.1 hypothetical protein RFI_21221 [Reticulomyxa filosa]